MSYTIKDDRTNEEKAKTIGFWVATDKFMSGWGRAQRKSYVACPVVSCEDSKIVQESFESRNEFKYVRYVGKDYKPKLRDGDALHIYNTRTSFRP